MGEYLQSFDIRNKKGVSPAAVLGLVLAAAGIAAHLHLTDAVLSPEALAANPLLKLLPNYRSGLIYALLGAALAVIGLLPDPYVRADLYTNAIVLFRKAPEKAEENAPREVYLFDDLDAVAASRRGLGDPQTLLIVPSSGRKVQIMVPPRNDMPAEAEALWRSYCVRFNREAEKAEKAEKDEKPGKDEQ